jgi:hypothetical protein
MVLTWVFGLFALMKRTFPGYGAKPPFLALISATAALTTA